MTRAYVLAILSVLAFAACSDDTKPATDGPVVKKDGNTVTPDGGVTPDGAVIKPDALPPAASALQVVFNKINLPKTGSEFAYDYDGSGPKNQLGSLTQTLASIPGIAGYDFQSNIDSMVTQGNLILLLDIQNEAKNIENDTATRVQVLMGDDGDSPPNPTDNFTGSEEFSIQIGSPKDMLFEGKITSKKLEVGPGTLIFPIPVGTPPVQVQVKNASMQGMLSSTPTSALTEGRVYGVIPWTEVEQKILPEIAKGVDATYKSGQSFLAIFDTDKDGTITAAELGSSPLLGLVLKADVDTDGDKQADGMSIGLGFTAVSCTIKK